MAFHRQGFWPGDQDGIILSRQRVCTGLDPRPAHALPSLTEALDLTTPTGWAMAGLLAVFAEFEREILRERGRARIVHARQHGKPHGRPPSALRKAAQIHQLFTEGLSKRAIARHLGIGRTSVRRILQATRGAEVRRDDATPAAQGISRSGGGLG